MKTFKAREGLKIVPESVEDLWLLTKIIEPGDAVSGRSARRVKALDLTRGDSGEKKKVFVELLAETIEFAEHASRLRITGTISSGSPPEFVQVGEHHTLDVETGDSFTLKKVLSPYHQELLEKARRVKPKALLVVVDDRGAMVARYSVRGIQMKCELASSASKRDPKAFEQSRKKFYVELTQAIQGDETVVVGGPGFAKEDYYKWLKEADPATAKRVRLATASTAERSGLNELVKNGAVEKAVGDAASARQAGALHEFLKRTARSGLACYGLGEVSNALAAGAVETLLLSDSLLRKSHGLHQEANALLEKALETGAEAVVFDSDTGAGLEFESFAVGALLRYKIR
ncbi:mRNA surveillance protein pelota [Candidatus Micrarchaeota archaeon CG_4_10_14_0_2_um_filter_55_9]|nr:MAG: mRNA surveillance protein pelota [Candidatus Micrarchaeota archaeon CG1_02_55_41]PIO03861.1 MAG: mRNA surveillance protein pelota [Candidatus Micrarchaeota archaeon CG09_land_8_20_14_0_10_55_25]PIZ91583.1 MAG: mRNA surveillance protein pelota [Candidatus Micrarchaeota archaeon CG_4_10_14_0_2_um_filter_55_9]